VLRRAVTGFVGDSLYRNSTFLMINSVLVAGLGFLFWTIAARYFTAGAVGTTTTVISAVTYAGMVGTLGLPNTVIRFLAREPDPVRLLSTVMVVALVAGALVGLLWGVVPGHLGIPLSTVATGRTTTPIIVAAVALASLGAVAQSAIIALRTSKWVIVENAAGSVFKLAAMPLAVGFGAAGLFGLFVGSLLMSGVTSVVIVVWLVGGSARRWLGSIDPRSVAPVRAFAAGNHLAALASMLPGPVIRIVVLSRLGAPQAAFLAMPLMILALVKVIPGIAAQSMFAEAAADEQALWGFARRTLRGIYVVLFPTIVALVVFARPLLSIFGADYADAGTTCLRLLALSAVFAGVNYVADTVLNAQRRVGDYVFVNLVGAACTMLLPIAFVGYGLTGVGLGWFLGQAAYCAVATATVFGRGRRASGARASGWAVPWR
jgi:O-antigen/teichoic acid export membrane protein